MSVLTPAFVNFVKQQNRKHNTLLNDNEKSLVKEKLRKSYPKIEKFYPIYSDTQDAWQADLTFFWEKAEDYVTLPAQTRKRKTKNPQVKRLKIAVLCVVNVNTRFAFAEVTEFTPNEVEEVEDSKKSYETQQKMNTEVVKGSNKTPDKVLAAFKKILKDMKDLKGSKLLNESGMGGYVRKVSGISFKVKTLYTDEGSEFKGAFDRFCKTMRIHHVTFSPSTGTKRRLGIVERFNRTLKEMIQTKWASEDQSKKKRSSVKALLPQVMKAYNYSKTHRGLKKFVRVSENIAKGKHNETARNMTPFAMSFPGNEKKYISVKEKERKDVDQFYKKAIDKLKRKPYVRFFKKLDTSDFKKFEDRFQRKGAGTLTENAFRIKNKHTYSHKRQNKSGDSFAIDGLNGFRVMPYDVEYPSAAFVRKFKKPRTR